MTKLPGRVRSAALGVLLACVGACGAGGTGSTQSAEGFTVDVPAGEPSPVPVAGGNSDGEAEPTREECDDAISAINAGVDAMTADTQSASPVDDLRALSARLEELSNELQRMDLQAPALRRQVEGYRRMIADVSKAATEMAAAVDAGDMDEVEASSDRLSKAADRESTLVDAINELCE